MKITLDLPDHTIAISVTLIGLLEEGLSFESQLIVDKVMDGGYVKIPAEDKDDD